jgi:hypothetical protein
LDESVWSAAGWPVAGVPVGKPELGGSVSTGSVVLPSLAEAGGSSEVVLPPVDELLSL